MSHTLSPHVSVLLYFVGQQVRACTEVHFLISPTLIFQPSIQEPFQLLITAGAIQLLLRNAKRKGEKC